MIYIRRYPDPILLAVAKQVETTDKAQSVASQLLIAARKERKAIGLAAPQIGLSHRVFLTWLNRATSNPVIFVNPIVLKASNVMGSAIEKCLSLPGEQVLVSRPVSIELGWYDVKLGYHRQMFTRDSARVILHELDHLNGKLIGVP